MDYGMRTANSLQPSSPNFANFESASFTRYFATDTEGEREGSQRIQAGLPQPRADRTGPRSDELCEPSAFLANTTASAGRGAHTAPVEDPGLILDPSPNSSRI